MGLTVHQQHSKPQGRRQRGRGAQWRQEISLTSDTELDMELGHIKRDDWTVFNGAI